MLSLLPLVEHLGAPPEGWSGRPWFRQVGGAGEYGKLNPSEVPLPGAWVLRARDTARHAGEREEDATIHLDVVIAVANARSHYAGETDEELLAYRRAVKTRLEGWFLEPDVRPLKFSGGQLLEVSDGDVFWTDRYEFRALVSNYLPDPPAFAGIQYTGEKL